MRWRTKSSTVPEVGDTRTIVVFAWWPTECVGGDTVWLERVWAFQRFAQTEVESGDMHTTITTHVEHRWHTNYFDVWSRA
jgi:hypothetical protein